MDIILTIYIIRVIACICALALMDKWDLKDNGIGTKTKKIKAVLFAFMPLYLFYLVGKNINRGEI